MSKYIIRNCPACLPMTKLCDCENMDKAGMYCWDCTDCLLKQIVELCKETLEQENDPINTLEMSFAQKILKPLDIQEVE